MKTLDFGDKFPYGKYKGLEVGIRLHGDFNYYKWWQRTIHEFPFGEKISQSIKNISNERYNREENIWNKQNIKKERANGARDSIFLNTFYNDEDHYPIIGLNGH